MNERYAQSTRTLPCSTHGLGNATLCVFARLFCHLACWSPLACLCLVSAIFELGTTTRSSNREFKGQGVEEQKKVNVMSLTNPTQDQEELIGHIRNCLQTETPEFREQVK